MIGVLTMYTLIWQIIKNQQKSWIECIGINPGNSKLEKSESMCDPYPAKTFSGQKGGTYKHAKKTWRNMTNIKTYQTSLRILKSDGKNIMVIMPLDLDLHINPATFKSWPRRTSTQSLVDSTRPRSVASLQERSHIQSHRRIFVYCNRM